MNYYVRSGRPSTSTTDECVEAVTKIVLDNHRIVIRDVAVGLCQTIFSDVLGTF